MTNKQFVLHEREYLVALLKGLQPEQWSAQTLCEGWSVEDLAAHLVVRERNIVGGIGLIFPSLSYLHDARIKKVESHGHQYIIEKLSNYPCYMPASLNITEFWVHNEDFLRAELKMSRPRPSKQENAILWNSLKGLARVRKSMVKDLGNVVMKNTETNETIDILFNNQTKSTNIAGTAGELLLYFYGRRDATKVKISS